MFTFFRDLKRDPASTLANWQETRAPWAWIGVAMLALVLIAHYVFQDWLFMAPCEQCVYIRYGNLVMALGALIAMINPNALWAKVAGYIITIYGLIYTYICSWKLMAIHDAIHSDDPMAMFGLQGCSMDPVFPFGLPLDRWAPAWFKPTGDCGYDAPMPPDGVDLSAMQQWLVDLWSEGWYLFPQWKLMDMAECCFLACLVATIFLGGMLYGWYVSATRGKA